MVMTKTFLKNLLLTLANNRHREILVIKGNKKYRYEALNLIIKIFNNFNNDFEAIEIVNQATDRTDSTRPVKQILDNKLSDFLGQEVDLVIFSSEQGINPNNLAQATGMIRAGGLCILSLQQDWLEQPNLAMQKYLSFPLRLEDGLNGFRLFLSNKLNQYAITIKQNKSLPDPPFKGLLTTNKQVVLAPTKEQLEVINAIQSVTFGHSRRPLLINAARGRGKSSSLGFATIELFKQGKQHIAISAANPNQTKQILTKAIQYSKNKESNFKVEQQLATKVIFSQKNDNKVDKTYYTIQFYAPDDLLQTKKQLDILLVDEAAHLPLPLLKQLSEKYSRIVFATTSSGYEGSGMGFKLKFTKILANLNYKQITMIQPIRWNEHDPLENTINKSLLLDNSQDTLAKTKIKNLIYQEVSTKKIADNPLLVKQIFILLINAHYQTSPNDLMQILEDPNLVLWLASNPAAQPAAVLLAFKEGGIEQIIANKRYQGHLVAQLLFQQSQQKSWLTQTSYRINRLAVHPELQNQSIGSNLLNAFIKNRQQKAELSYLSVSFAATTKLINFWTKQHFLPAYLGIKRDKSSATYSITMLYGLNDFSQQQIFSNMTIYATQFAYLLQSTFQSLDVNLIIKLLQLLNFKKIALPIGYLNNQPFETVSSLLQQWSLANPNKINKLTMPIKDVWVKKILQNKSWQEVVSQSDYISRKQIEEEFRKFLKTVN